MRTSVMWPGCNKILNNESNYKLRLYILTTDTIKTLFTFIYKETTKTLQILNFKHYCKMDSVLVFPLINLFNFYKIAWFFHQN